MSKPLSEVLDSASDAFCNVVLTGTAGDGKTSLCNEVWERLGGDDSRSTGASRDHYMVLPVNTASGG